MIARTIGGFECSFSTNCYRRQQLSPFFCRNRLGTSVSTNSTTTLVYRRTTPKSTHPKQSFGSSLLFEPRRQSFVVIIIWPQRIARLGAGRHRHHQLRQAWSRRKNACLSFGERVVGQFVVSRSIVFKTFLRLHSLQPAARRTMIRQQRPYISL